jgi:hypothetical protein
MATRLVSARAARDGEANQTGRGNVDATDWSGVHSGNTEGYVVMSN